MYLWYKILTYLFYPFANFFLFIRKIKKKEHISRYKEKLAKIEKHRGDGLLIWFHAASVGECMSILPLIQELEVNPKVNKILVTSITLSSSKILHDKFSQNSKVIHQFLPLDIPSFVKHFLSHWSPDIAIFVDSEIWPNFILEINKRNIPLVLLNGRITRKTFLRWRLIPQFAKKIFQSFQLSIPANRESQKYLEKFNVKVIKYFGNIKLASEQKFKEISSNDARFFNNRLFWSAVSVHEGEDMFCLKTHLKIKKQHNNITTIIIPRHVDRVKKIKLICKKLNLKYQILSENKDIEKNKEILIVNSYGVTTQFLTLCNSVFIGKSMEKKFEKVGGQNPIEAAKLGCKIYHGPYVYNFQDIYNLLEKSKISEKVLNEDELSNKISVDFNQDRLNRREKIEMINKLGEKILNDTCDELEKIILK